MTREFNWHYDEDLHVLDILQNGKLVLSIPRSTLVTLVDDLHHTKDFEEVFNHAMETVGG